MQLWDVNFTRTYVQLSPQANPTLVAAKIKHFLDGYNKLLNANFKIDLGLQRFEDVYLHSNFDNGIPGGGRIAYVRLFSGVAVFILLIACINFMNLATATSIKRSREIGIRKVVGALRSVLIVQFTGEAILLAALAMLVALLLVFLCLPAFNSITGKQIAFPLFNLHYLLPLLFLVLLTGLIAGSYPAFFLSSLQPIRVLKGKLRIGTGPPGLARGWSCSNSCCRYC
jgi:ABC-type antimicrobial peptide transport system permease subunit